MTVKELIEKLQGMPQDLPVYIANSCAEDGVTFLDPEPAKKTLFINKNNEPTICSHLVGSPQITFVQF